MKISTKILLPVLLILTIGFFISTVFTYQMSNDAIEESSASSQKMAIANAIVELESKIEFDVLNAISLAQTGLLQPYLEGTSKQHLENSVAAGLRIINMRDTYFYVMLGILDTKGLALHHTEASFIGKSFADEPFFIKAMTGKVAVGNPYRYKSMVVYPVASPVFHIETKEIIGVVFNVSLLEDTMSERMHLGDKGYILVADSDGLVFIHKNSSNILTQNMNDVTWGQIMLKAQKGELHFMENGKHKMSYYETLLDTDWLVVAVVDMAELMEPSVEILRNGLIVDTLILLCLAAILFICVNKIIQGLLKAVKYAENIAQGNLDEQLDIYQKDEIGELCTSLRNMVKNLKEKIEEANMQAEIASKKNGEALIAMQSAKDATKAKSQFLANMSHEIRTPINAISGFAEIILRENCDRNTEELTLGIKSACDSLINIIDDILDIAKVESGKLEIVNSKYSLASLINDVINMTCMRLGDKPLLFAVNIDSRLPAVLCGDEIRVKQILINLLTNAIKFTDTGYIHLSINGTFTGKNMALSCSVKDSGIGITQEDLNCLFEEFKRVNTKKNRAVEGTGLGLPISKRLTEMMNGKIEVESTLGEGSTFHVTIPQTYFHDKILAVIKEKKSVLLYEPRSVYADSIKEALDNLDCDCHVCSDQSDLYDNAAHEGFDYIFTSSLNVSKLKQFLHSKKSTTKIVFLADFNYKYVKIDVCTLSIPTTCVSIAGILNNESNSDYDSSMHDTGFVAPEAKILIVDDSNVNLKVARGLMKPFQFQIDTAINGLEAVKMVKNNKYDIIFMDHMMPEMDGIDATIAIRNMEGDYYKKIPIIALTANAIAGSREIFLRAGMSDFLAKPIKVGKLNSMISKWIPSDKKKELESLERLNIEENHIRIEGVNSAIGIASIGGSVENYIHILSIYYAEGMKKNSQLLEMFTAGDILGLKVEVHALKSTSATIGAENISSEARKLEEAAISNDLSYLGDNVAIFVINMQNLLSNIEACLKKHAKEKHCDQLSDVSATKSLREYLDELHEAIEFANIVKIETLLEDIFTYRWSAETIEELQKIRNAIAGFAYDEALSGVKHLQEKS